MNITGWHSPDIWMLALAITVVVLTGFGIFSRWCAFSPAVPREKLDQLRVGMTQDEVTALLGEPRERRMEGPVQEWSYGLSMKRHVLLLHFGKSGKLLSFVHSAPDESAPTKPGSYEG
jgi:hypothetical protein